MTFRIFILSLVILVVSCEPQKKEIAFYNEGINITPKPTKLLETEEEFVINNNTKFVVFNESLNPIASYFSSKIAASSGIEIKNEISSLLKDNFIALKIVDTLDLNEEAYSLEVKKSQITIIGKTAKGVFYGLQTLMQLLPAEIENKSVVANLSLTIPGVSIKDAPAFAWRGLHLDVSRHFYDVDFIKKQLDIMALFKLNKFHWHFTDDQGWRIEIKKYPKLTSLGSKRIAADGSVYGEGAFYTQEQIKEVVAYAAARQIDILPEIDVPGHAIAALEGYPELACNEGPFNTRILWGVETDIFCAGKETTFSFIEDVMKEVTSLFPYKYVHIGGDEVPKDRWEVCPHCQKRMKTEKIENTAKLQTYFMNRVESILAKYDKKVIGWDEILEGGASQTTTIMSWRGEKGGIAAANAGNDVIMTPSTFMYLNFYQGDYKVEPFAFGAYIPLKDVYNYYPVPEAVLEENKKHILGVQANIWTEYTLDNAILEYQAYPRLLAVAEAGWSSKKDKSFEDFEKRLHNQYVRLDAHDINYHIPLPEGPSSQLVFVDSIVVPFTTTRPIKMVYTLDGSEPTINSVEYKKPFIFKENTTLKIASVLPHGKMSSIRSISIKKEPLTEAVAVEAPQKGLRLAVFPGNFRKIEDINLKETSINSKGASLNEVNKTYHWGHEVKEDHFKASILTGFIEIPEDGVYFFL